VKLYEVKGKVHPSTGHEDPEGEDIYSSTLSLTSALDGDGWLAPRPAHFTPGKDPVGLRAGLDRCGKSRPLPEFDRTQRVAIPTELSRPIIVLMYQAEKRYLCFGRHCSVVLFRLHNYQDISEDILKFMVINFDLDFVLSSTFITCTNESFDDLSVEISPGDTVDLSVQN